MQHPHGPARRTPATKRAVSRVAHVGLAVCAGVVALPYATHPYAAAPHAVLQATAHYAATHVTSGAESGAVEQIERAALPDGPAVPLPILTILAPTDAEAGAPAFTSAAGAERELRIRRYLTAAAPGTYIDELLEARDSAVTRWPARVERPLTVWVADAARLPGWRPTYLGRVADAFATWTRAGVPLRFRFVADSGAAEVHVRWIDRFREPISGRTVWSRDGHWWMTGAEITLALHHSDGAPLDDEQMRTIALHEVGHLLGLDHTSDPTSVMAPRVRVRDLSAADGATARLVYTLPPGHL